jgi:triphosphoribosyl-dephospho-CoA synthase
MSYNSPAERLNVGQCATLACLWEASIPKPGNVHRGADFADLTFYDFATSAVALGPAMQQASNGSQSLGQTVLAAIQATRALVQNNPNLGTVLLLAPMCMVPTTNNSLAEGTRAVLANLSSDDARDVYDAIRLAQPGGMGEVSEADLDGDPPSDLLHAMRLAETRDLVARQYVNGFAQVFDHVVPWLVEGLTEGLSLIDTVIHVQMRLMAEFPDSLIARKCGQPIATAASHQARHVLESGPPMSPAYAHSLESLDFWLRSDGHRRNPGTTADLLAAGLFVLLRDEIIKAPYARHWMTPG